MAQLCVQHQTEGDVFELSAKLLESEPLQQAQKLQKAYRAYTQVYLAFFLQFTLNQNIYYFISFIADTKRMDQNTRINNKSAKCLQ